MKTINVTVRDKIASAVGDIVYICGNSDYVIDFDFDAEWDDYDVKTARFVHNGTYTDVVFTGEQCAMPVIHKAYGIYVGVYAGDLRTTTPAHIPSAASILSAEGTPAAPPDDVYAQITALCSEAVAEAKRVRDDADAGKFNGAPGKTPVVGEDYFTEADKQAIAANAAEAVGFPQPAAPDNGKYLGCENGKAAWMQVEASGGGGVSLGLTGVKIGQTIRVKAVDESGKPTEWEAADSNTEQSFPKFEKILSHTITEEEAAAAPTAFIWGTDKIPNLNDFNVFTINIRSPDDSKIVFTKWIRLRINNLLLGNITGGVSANSRGAYTVSANRIYGFWVSDSIYDPAKASGQALATPYSALSYTSNLADSVEVTSIGFASYGGINELYAGVIVEIWGAK